MRHHLITLVVTALVLFSPFSTCLASTDAPYNGESQISIDLPEALADDDSFDELPFQQLRQALREEVEPNPNRSAQPRSYKKYNLLIR